MKKFLSLALSLVMILSLVTISAGATEYADLTDKDEIKYEEAVAVLNRIGVITGYEDGSFKPEAELSRGAAAKIIVSLLIGPEAAENLGNNSSPYPDVPAGNNFAGVISFCKTSKIINGYGDGTFRPTANLTGFAFAKMLLGALGYKSEIEGMSGEGWNMVVANLGQEAGLFDRLRFNGNDPVNREMACQMALNTLKGNLVEYKGGFTVSAGAAQVQGAQTRSVKTSNQDYAGNIRLRNDLRTDDDYLTVQFAEEHFVDLRMTSNKWNPVDDNFGNPSVEWDYRKVTIGTFPLDPDFSYTTKVADKDKSTDASKVRALGLSGYKITDDTQLYINGKETATTILQDGGKYVTGKIADLTDNGTLVKVYVNNNVADEISAIVVIKSQLMEIKKVGSDFVSLDKYDGGDGANSQKPGFNQDVLDTKVNNVEVNDDYYEFLSGKKAGDKVVIIPVTVDHSSSTYEVGGAYTPETVSGTLTRVTTYGQVNDSSNVGAVDITLGGTKYPIALWNAGDLNTITADIIDVTKKDVTLYLDSYGNALLADEVGSQDGYMVIKGFYQTLVSGKMVTMVEGWDVGGDPVSLNVGYNHAGVDGKMVPGDLVKYQNDGTMPSGADWRISDGSGARIYNVETARRGGDTADYEIKASNVRIRLDDGTHTDSYLIDNGVKFIYVTFDDDGDVDSIEIKKGVQSVENGELIKKNDDYPAWSNPAEAYTNKDGAVKAVVIKRESNEAISNNLLYVRDVLGTEGVDANGDKIYGYTVARMSADGLAESETIYSTKKLNRGDFASYALSSHSEFDPFYTLKLHDVRYKTTSVNAAAVAEIMKLNKNLIRLGGYTEHGGYAATDIASDYRVLGDSVDGNESNVVNLRNAKWLDIATTDGRITSADELIDELTNGVGKAPADGTYNGVAYSKGDYAYAPGHSVELQFVYNDNRDSDGFRMVNLVIVTKINQAFPAIGEQIKDVLPAKDSIVKIGNLSSEPVVKDSDTARTITFKLTSAAQAKAILKSDVIPAASTNAKLTALTVNDVDKMALAATDKLMPGAVDGTYTVVATWTAIGNNSDTGTVTYKFVLDSTVAPETLVPSGVQGASKANGFTAKAPTATPTGATVEFTEDDAGTTTPTGIEIERQSAAGTQTYALEVTKSGDKITISGISAGKNDGTGDAAGVTVTYTAATEAVAKGAFVQWNPVTLVDAFDDQVAKYYTVKAGVDKTNASFATTADNFEEVSASTIEAGPVANTEYYTESGGTYTKATLPKALPSTVTGDVYVNNTELDADGKKTEAGPAKNTDPIDGTKFYYTKQVTAEATEAEAATIVVEMTKAFLNTFTNNGEYVIKSVKVLVTE